MSRRVEAGGLRSQRLRLVGPEIDPLWLGAGWTVEEADRPQVLIESTYGDSHTGSKHLNRFVEMASNSIYQNGGKPASFTVTDICDGIATGHDGMNYSLVSRDIIAAMVEIHASAFPCDALVLMSSCDKATPGHLMAMARLNLPAIHVSGGSMAPGPGLLSAEKCYECIDLVREGKMTRREQIYYQQNSCPTCGACQYMGTANTMQCMSEALGLSLPGNALVPAVSNLALLYAHNAGRQALALLEKDITPSKILTEKAFENAIMVHSAIAGSTNAMLHLPAIAKQVGIPLDPDLFDNIHRKIPVLTSIKTSGKWPTQYLWYAGGIPAIMRAIEGYLHLDCLTVTGKTVGENLEECEEEGFFRQAQSYLENFGLKPSDIIQTVDNPVYSGGGMAVLRGNIAPEGAVVKHSACAPEMHVHTGPARVFNCEEDAVAAILEHRITPGDVMIIRYEGPKGAGMPEMLRTTEAIYTDPALVSTTALVTDGRFSGATRGPAIGHVSPEAAEGGPLALVEDGDIIGIDIPHRSINVVGLRGNLKSPAEIDVELARRRASWKNPLPPKKGILRVFGEMADSPMRGASM